MTDHRRRRWLLLVDTALFFGLLALWFGAYDELDRRRDLLGFVLLLAASSAPFIYHRAISRKKKRTRRLNNDVAFIAFILGVVAFLGGSVWVACCGDG